MNTGEAGIPDIPKLEEIMDATTLYPHADDKRDGEKIESGRPAKRARVSFHSYHRLDALQLRKSPVLT